MDYNEEVETIIEKKYDYSNAIVTESDVSYIAQCCDQIYRQFCNLINEDEKNNERLKIEYRQYNYKKSYGVRFLISIKNKDFKVTECSDYVVFMEYVKNGKLKNIESVEIELALNFKRGREGSLNEHENLFRIFFRPYEIKFTRKSNYHEDSMDKIENYINDKLSKLPVVNTIFFSK